MLKKSMKQGLALLCAASMVLSPIASFDVKAANSLVAQEGPWKEFYVSPSGDDQAEGTKEAPFKTVEKARQAVDAVNEEMTGDIIVNIAAGDYFIDETIQMTKADSGFNGHEVIYRCDGAPGTARLIGGQKVSGWAMADENDVTGYDLPADMIGNVWKVELDASTPEFNTMYVNGKRATMARSLNDWKNDRFPASHDEYMYAPAGSASGIAFPTDKLSQNHVDAMKRAIERGEEGAQVYGWDWDYRNWFTSTIPVVRISDNWLYFPESPADNKASYRPKYNFGNGARFFLQGNLAFLDVPGEYHYNKITHTLYYYPKAEDGALEVQEIIIPSVQEIFRLNGDEKAAYNVEPNPDDQIHNITFEGLEIGYTEFDDTYSSGWNAYDALGIGAYPEEALREGITQPSYCEQTERKEYRKGAVTLTQSHHITLDSMRIMNVGLMGISAWGDNNNLTVKNSELGNIGGHGINIDGGYPGPNTGCYSYGHLITNNVIHDMGQMFGHGTGMQILQVHDSEFSHLEIYNASRRAIFLEGAWASRTDKDKGFVRYRDAHTYENDFNYLYLHDLQQDGGDDGAFFICTLYGSWGDQSGDKPNRINQLYMDNVGSPSSNHDFKPNCMNLDMGCDGMIINNMKAVNPQHYNVIWGGKVTFNNVNNSYFNSYSDENSRNFDESKMEYDKIGVNAEFPYPDAVTTVVGDVDKTDADYEDLYYRDEFDNGLDEWWSLAGKPSISSLYYSDNDNKNAGHSFLADAFYGDNKSSEGCLIGKPFGTDLNKIVEIDYYDHMNDGMEDGYCGMSFQYMLNSFARVDDGGVQRAIGVDHNKNGTYYSYKIGSLTRVTDVKREYGWHKFKWDYTSGNDVKMYIDGKEIATVPANSFSYIEMGDYGMGGFNAYDNVVIYGGDEAPDPIPLPEPPTPEEPEETEKGVLPGTLEAEEADELPAGTRIQNIQGGKAVTYMPASGKFIFNVTAKEEFELPLTVRYASNNPEASFDVVVDGVTQFNVKLAPSKGWDTYLEFTTSETINFTEGKHTVELVIRNNNFNLDSIAFLIAEEPEEPVAVESIKPAVQDKLVLSIGNTTKVPVKVLPVNAGNKALIWSTDDVDGQVITVTEDGTITAKAVGTANVTVVSEENSEITATFQVEVQDTEASLISTTENGCVPSATSQDSVNNGPDKLIDGSFDGKGSWNALNAGNGGIEDPSAYLEWETEQTVKTIQLYDIAEGGNYIEKMEIIFDDNQDTKIILEDGVPDGGMKEIVLEEARDNVKKIEFHILKAIAPYRNYGFSEIKVFSDEPGKVPVNSVFFDVEDIGMFPGDTYTLKPAIVVPSSATDKKLTVEIDTGADIIQLKENMRDGLLQNYTITALKTGTAVIRATASNGVYTELLVIVGDKEQLGYTIMQAECLYGKYPGKTDAHKGFRKVIDKAIRLYESSSDMKAVGDMILELESAMNVFEEAFETEETAESVAEALTIENPKKEDAYIKMPEVPVGFKVDIESVDPEGIINLAGKISMPDEDTEVKVTLRVTKISDSDMATKECIVMVLGCTPQEVMDNVDIPNPVKKQKKLELPKVPEGFTITIEESTNNTISKDGTITWTMDTQEVIVKILVAKSADNYVEKEFTFILPGLAKQYGQPIEANDIDELYGSAIKIQDNEVFNFNPGDWIRYDNVDFGETDSISKILIETAVHPNWEGKTIEVVLDDINGGKVIGSVVVKSNGDWGVYGIQEAVLNSRLSGKHTIYLRGVAGGAIPSEGVAGIKTIKFDKTDYHAVTVDEDVENGTLTVDKAVALENDKVTVNAIAADGYQLKEGTLKVIGETNGETLALDGNTFTMIADHVIVTAEFEVISEPEPEPQPEYVTITFKANGGIVSESTKTVEKGTAYGTLPVATRNGYNFLGWYNGSTRVRSTDICNRDVTLTAKWEKKTNPVPQPKYVTVTFNANGGIISPSSLILEKGTAYGILPTATRNGYNFLGWYNGTTQVKSTDICNKDVTLIAKWEEIKNESKPVTKITLNETKKSLVKGTSFTLQAIVEPSNATNKNVIWTSSNTKVATVDANGKVTAKGNGKATIKATAADGSKVKASCDVTVAYKITYVMNKGENHESNPSMYYETKVSLKAPSRKGYTFKGWYTDKKLKNKISSISASSSKDITVYAKWEKIKVGKVTVKNLQSKVAGTMIVNYTKVKNASGYEIIYGTDAKITKNKKTITTKASSVTIEKLKKGKTYYVKVRAYKKDSIGKHVYGAYSKVMKVNIKK